MSALWTSAAAAKATGGQAAGKWAATGVSIDTRTLQPGDLFVALKAARDGHEFVAQALEKGAAAALVSHVPEGVDPEKLLIVEDVLRGLEALGQAARKRTKARIAAITGSVGKTSTKEMLRAALAGQGKVHAAEASYNNHWGVPLTLARMPADTDFGIFEIGMSNPGEIAPLARQVRPHVAMITTIAAAHLEAFEDLDGIAREKASIMEGLEKGGGAVVNGDLPQSPILVAAAEAAGAKVKTFGEKTSNHHRATDLRIGQGRTVATARGWRTPLMLSVASEGRHFAINALGVLAVAQALGVDRARALCGLANWSPQEGRGQREVIHLDPVLDEERFELIDDAFNANPASMAAALEVLAASEPRDDIGRVAAGRRVAILGDMLELGPDELELHRAIADDPAIAKISRVHCVGPRMKALYEVLPPEKQGRWTKSAAEMREHLRQLMGAGDVVLVKGSKGIKVSLLVDAIRKMGKRRADEAKD